MIPYYIPKTGSFWASGEFFPSTPVQYVQVNGVMSGYREFGTGEPLLLLAGFSATMDGWNETFFGIPAMKYHVYTYENRGMGYSSDDNAIPTVLLYADDAARIITALGYDSIHDNCSTYSLSKTGSLKGKRPAIHPYGIFFGKGDYMCSVGEFPGHSQVQ